MSRGLALNLLASALTILATIAFLGATAVGNGATMDVPAESDVRPVVYAFYDAINTVLRSGDSAALDAVVAPHFVMRGALVSVSADRDGLVRHLVATSAVTPTLHLDIAELAVAGNRALVHLEQTTSAGGGFLGVPLATIPALWGQFDALRISGGQVTELWSGDDPVPLLESLRQARLEPLLRPDQTMMVRRLSAEAVDRWTWASTYQSRVLYVDAGAITIEVDAASPAPAVIVTGAGHDQERLMPPGARGRVQPGEALVLSPIVQYRLHGDPSPPALRAYEVAFPLFIGTGASGAMRNSPQAAATDPRPKLPGREFLGEVADPGLPHDTLIASFGRLTLPPGTSLTLAAARGPVVLIVEAGTLGIDQRADPTTEATRLAPGDETIIPVAQATSLEAVGTEPVVVFMVTVLPDHTETRVLPPTHVGPSSI